jgi:hypothetical protein
MKGQYMFKSLLFGCVGGALLIPSALAQNSTGRQSKLPAAAPIAYVYVSSSTGLNQPNVVFEYSAAANGALTAIPGSPVKQNESSMAVNGKYLVGVDDNPTSSKIDTLQIGSNGALTYITTAPCLQSNNECAFAGNVYFDHTGSNVYVMEIQGSENSQTASYTINRPTGILNYLGTTVTGVFPGDYTPTFFIGNNEYAYSADQSGCMYPGIYSYQRDSNGMLNSLGVTFISPQPPSSFSTYYPDLAVADPTVNLAILEQPANPPGCAPGPLQIAVFTADANGNLTTNSTYQNMPATAIKNPYDMKMSPSGQLLAVAGQEGLQIFHFNGSNPVTRYTGLLTKDPINQMFWDNSNHLYAISSTTGKLYVGTITPTSLARAPGSPYTITSPQEIIVQPLK